MRMRFKGIQTMEAPSIVILAAMLPEVTDFRLKSRFAL
jgi:hypothetical protein